MFRSFYNYETTARQLMTADGLKPDERRVYGEFIWLRCGRCNVGIVAYRAAYTRAGLCTS